MEKLHSVQSAAEFLGGISPWTIRAWLSQGRLARYKVGSRTMVREADLLQFVHCETPGEASKRNIAVEALRKKKTTARAR
jgi:excisionase family DNA binding protein